MKTVKQIIQNAKDNQNTVEEVFSNCCGAEASKLSDSLCGECLEHAEFN